jgi:hypothetical protein
MALAAWFLMRWKIECWRCRQREETAAYDYRTRETLVQATSRHWRKRYESLKERSVRQIALGLVEARVASYEEIAPIIRRHIE